MEHNREQIVKVLEQMSSKANCNHMRHLDGYGCFCIRLGKNVHDMAKGRSPECNENCEHFSPPYIEKVLRSALALIREQAEENEILASHHKTACDAVKIDTVRKMQERLEKIRVVGSYGVRCYLKDDVDQIVKEMLEDQE